MKFLLTCVILITITWTHAQATFTLEVSADTASIGELIEVKYILENGEGEFEVPDMEGLPVISGPNSASSFSIQNGRKSSSHSFSFILEPFNEGLIEIPGASYTQNGQTLTVDPVRIVVTKDPERGQLKQSYKSSSSPSSSSTSSSSPLYNREKRKF